jgi:hypothetical protein
MNKLVTNSSVQAQGWMHRHGLHIRHYSLTCTQNLTELAQDRIWLQVSINMAIKLQFLYQQGVS